MKFSRLMYIFPLSHKLFIKKKTTLHISFAKEATKMCIAMTQQVGTLYTGFIESW